MNTTRLGGIVTVAGSIMFCIAAFMPTSQVFAEPDPARKLAILRHSPRGWLISQFLFSGGATLAAVGMGIVARQLRPRPAIVLAHIGTALLVVGVALWNWHVYLRSTDPERFVAGLIPSWLFGYYSVLTDVGFMAFGIAFLVAAFPVWIGTSMIGFPLVFLAAFLIFKDLPPFFYYVLLSAVGAAVSRQANPPT